MRHVKLFRVGHSQVLRIPREFELPGDEAVICREGQRLVLEPTQRPSLTRLLAGWRPIDTEWPVIDDTQSEPAEVEEGLRLVVRLKRQEEVRKLRGRLSWTADLEAMRSD